MTTLVSFSWIIHGFVHTGSFTLLWRILENRIAFSVNSLHCNMWHFRSTFKLHLYMYVRQHFSDVFKVLFYSFPNIMLEVFIIITWLCDHRVLALIDGDLSTVILNYIERKCTLISKQTLVININSVVFAFVRIIIIIINYNIKNANNTVLSYTTTIVTTIIFDVISGTIIRTIATAISSDATTFRFNIKITTTVFPSSPPTCIHLHIHIHHYNIFKEINSMFKSSPGYDRGWSRDQTLWGPKGFSEDFIMF